MVDAGSGQYFGTRRGVGECVGCVVVPLPFGPGRHSQALVQCEVAVDDVGVRANEHEVR